MQVRELADRLSDVLRGVPMHDRPLVLKGWMAHLSKKEKQDVTTLVGLFGFDIPKSRRVLVLIHGIRTAGVWQDLVEEAFNGTDIRVVPIGYEFHDTVRFLWPWRRGVVHYVREQLRQVANDFEGAEISLIAHSFGTYIASRVLRSDRGIRFARIAFCGSIVAAKFPWASIDGLPSRDNFVNDAGFRDAWPVLARSCSWGFGTSGSFGFRQAGIQDRFHDLDHSGFFSDSWIRRFWLPFFIKGDLVRTGVSRPTPPYWMHFLTIAQLEYLALLLVLLALIH